MVNEAKNSPAVIMWSIGNEIPGWGTSAALSDRAAADRRYQVDRHDPAGGRRLGSLPQPLRVRGRARRRADAPAARRPRLNYDTAQTIDALHKAYPTTFFFESEAYSETSTRGYYQDPNLLNTGQNFTPGKRELSSYDNNLDDWTMSAEYGVKKDRDRQFFAGEFIWSGFDYIGEPTPYTSSR